MSVDYEALRRTLGGVGLDIYRQMEFADKLEKSLNPYEAMKRQIDEISRSYHGLHIYSDGVKDLHVFDRNRL